MQFYNGKVGVHTPAQLRHMYEQSAGSNNALIIDIAPFPNGTVPSIIERRPALFFLGHISPIFAPFFLVFSRFSPS